MIKTFCDCCGKELDRSDKRWPLNPGQDTDRSWQAPVLPGEGTAIIQDLSSTAAIYQEVSVKMIMTVELSRSGHKAAHVCYNCIWRAIDKMDMRGIPASSNTGDAK